MQKASKSTDFRVSLSVCTMFNVLMDAKKQCSKLCVLDSSQEVGPVVNHLFMLCEENSKFGRCFGEIKSVTSVLKTQSLFIKPKQLFSSVNVGMSGLLATKHCLFSMPFSFLQIIFLFSFKCNLPLIVPQATLQSK